MTDRLTKFNPETNQYEYRERAKTQEEFNAQRKAVIQRLGEFEDKSTDVAEEIFAEIEASAKVKYWRGGGLVVFEVNGEDFAELKKKYIGKDTNVTTNTED